MVRQPAKHKRSLGVLAALALFALSTVAAMKVLRLGPFAVESRSAPVVIFVVMDTLRADRASLCGYEHPTTPELEALVGEGASVACRSHAPSTWTLPSHASFFTGVELDGHGAGDGGGVERMKWGSVTPLGPELPTLAEEMSARGYQTLLLSGNPVVSERLGLTRGFDHVAIGRRYPMMHDHRLAERLEGLLRVSKLDRGRPLFAFINIADPHAPWTEIPEGVGFLPARPRLPINPGRERFESGAMDEQEAARYLAHLSDVYDYAVLRADRSLGLVLDVLENHGWLDQSYRLVITSDHGEYLGEHGMIEHGRAFLFEPVTRVPLLYFSTEGELPLQEDLPAIAAHTLARDGALPKQGPPKLAAAFHEPSGASGPRPPCSYAGAALWLAGNKLVASEGTVVRFDLNADPTEAAPQPADDHPAAETLLAHCRALDAAYAARPTLDEELDAALTEQLKALGYLRDGESGPAKQSTPRD